MHAQVRWGVLGCARIARLQVIPAMLRCDNAILQAVASRDANKLAEFKAQFGSFNEHAGYEALIHDPSVDAIYLPLPNSMHCEWAIRAMRAGKHVLCEKPLAMNSDEAEQMILVARECGVLLMEAFMYRYTARIRQIVNIVASGVLGQIRNINSTFRFLLDRENTIKENPSLGGGALYDVGCYPLNLIGLITGKSPVSCVVECDKHHGVDVNLSAILRYGDGLIASLHCGFNAFGRMHSEIIGTQGVLESTDTFLDTAGELIVHSQAGREVIPVPASDRYAEEIRDFSAAILEKRPPLLTLEESLRNMRIMDQLQAQAARVL